MPTRPKPPRPSSTLPRDGHTLATVIEEIERWTGVGVERIYVDKSLPRA